METQIPALHEVRPEVAAFARLMEYKLRQHDEDRGRAGWKRFRPRFALDWVSEALSTVDEALHPIDDGHGTDDDRQLLVSKCANLANYAMMIADMCGGLAVDGEPAAFREWAAKLASDAIDLYRERIQEYDRGTHAKAAAVQEIRDSFDGAGAQIRHP